MSDPAACLDPIGARDTDPPPDPPTCVADAVEALEAHHAAHQHYDDDLVAALLTLLDRAAEEVASLERDRYAVHLERTARNGRGLAEPTRAGLRLAANHLRRDLASYRPGDPR